MLKNRKWLLALTLNLLRANRGEVRNDLPLPFKVLFKRELFGSECKFKQCLEKKFSHMYDNPY